MAEATEPKPVRVRPSRRTMYVREIVFELVEKGYSQVAVSKEVEVRDSTDKEYMEYTLDQFLKKPKDVKVIRFRGNRTSAAVTRQAITQESWTDEENIIRYRVIPKKLGRDYVSAMKLYTTDTDGYDADDNGPIKPWLHVLFHDGSQIDIPLIKKKRRGK